MALEMTDRSVNRPVIIASLAEVFRSHGYEGASLSLLAEAADLRKASLYYHFPGGKEEMAEAVLSDSLHWFEENIFAILRGPGDPTDRLITMTTRLNDHFAGGESVDLFGFMALGATRDRFASFLTDLFSNWIGSLSKCLIEAGLARDLAVQRAADAVMEIEGALVLSRALGDSGPFQRVMRRLPDVLLIGDEARAVVDAEAGGRPEAADSETPTAPAESDAGETAPGQGGGSGLEDPFEHWEDEIPDEAALAAMVPELAAPAPNGHEPGADDDPLAALFEDDDPLAGADFATAETEADPDTAAGPEADSGDPSADRESPEPEPEPDPELDSEADSETEPGWPLADDDDLPPLPDDR